MIFHPPNGKFVNQNANGTSKNTVIEVTLKLHSENQAIILVQGFESKCFVLQDVLGFQAKNCEFLSFGNKAIQKYAKIRRFLTAFRRKRQKVRFYMG